MDNGKKISVFGKTQVMAYFRSRGISFYLRPSLTILKFWDQMPTSIGKLQVHIYMPNISGNLSFTMDVVDLDVPLLLGFRKHHAEWLIVDYWEKQLLNKRSNWYLNSRKVHWHLLEIHSISSYFSLPDIDSTHPRFFHRSAEKLYNLIKH